MGRGSSGWEGCGCRHALAIGLVDLAGDLTEQQKHHPANWMRVTAVEDSAESVDRGSVEHLDAQSGITV